MKSVRITLFFLLLFPLPVLAQSWTAKLDTEVRFYQPTDLGILIVGTEKSLYAIDSETGETLWRRKNVSLDETDVAPVPGTDLLLISLEKGDKARIEATDLFTGKTTWRSDKLKGAVMQMAVDPAALIPAPKLDRKIPAHLSEVEMNRLVETPDIESPLGRRDRAMLELFYASGLRLSELVGLDLEEVNLRALPRQLCCPPEPAASSRPARLHARLGRRQPAGRFAIK